MTNSITATSAHPKRDFSQITQLGLKAVNLALLYQAVIEVRLPVGTLDGVTSDIDALSIVVPGAKQTRDEAQTATAEQTAAVKKGYVLTRAVRRAVTKADAPDEVKKAYGVGQNVRPKLVRDVSSMLKQILDRATQNPAEAASVGIVQKDLDAMSAAHKAIGSADKTQEEKLASAPLSTKERNQTANRILKAVARISGAGALEFAEDPELRKAFEALKPASKRRKSGKVKGQTQGGEAPRPPKAPLPANDTSGPSSL